MNLNVPVVTVELLWRSNFISFIKGADPNLRIPEVSMISFWWIQAWMKSLREKSLSDSESANICVVAIAIRNVYRKIKCYYSCRNVLEFD